MLVTPQITWSLLSFTAFWSFVFHDTDFVPKRFLSILLLVHPVQWIAFCVVIRWIDIPDCTLSFVGVSSLKVKIQVCTLWLMKQQDSALYEFDAWFSLHTGKNSSSTSAFLSGVRYSPDGKSIWNKFFLSWGGNIYHPLQYFSCFFVPNVIFCVVSLQDTNFKIMAWQWASSQGVWQDSAIFLHISGSEIFHQISGWSNHLRFFLKLTNPMSRKIKPQWMLWWSSLSLGNSWFRRIKAERYVYWRTPWGKATCKP